MVHSPRPAANRTTTNVRMEPYTVVSDTSTVVTDYASVASNESFYDNPYTIDGRPVFGPWPKPTLPVKSRSDSNQGNKLIQFTGNDLKKSSSDVAVDAAAIHYEKPSEINATIVDFAKKEQHSALMLKKQWPEKVATTMFGQTNPTSVMIESGVSDETESEHSVRMMAPILSPKEQNKLRFEQLQQRLASVTTPLASMLGTRIETTGESSTDQDFEINEIGSSTMTKVPAITLHPISDSVKSTDPHNEFLDELSRNASLCRRKRAIDLLQTASVLSMAIKSQKLMDATCETAVSQDDIHLDTIDSAKRSNVSIAKEKCVDDLMLGIGKILHKESGGIAALYKHTLEKPNSRLGKIVYSMLV